MLIRSRQDLGFRVNVPAPGVGLLHFSSSFVCGIILVEGAFARIDVLGANYACQFIPPSWRPG